MSDHLADQFGMTDGAPASDTTGSEADASSMYDGGGDSTYGMDGDMYDDAQADTEDAADTTGTDTDSSTDTDTDSDPAGSDSGSGDNITMTYEGTSYDAGEASYDSDGDGQADTAVQDHGYQVEYYVDSDGDGQADELTITDADGNLISHTENVEGTDSWEETPAPDTTAGEVSSQSGDSSESSEQDSSGDDTSTDDGSSDEGSSDESSSASGTQDSGTQDSGTDEAPQSDSAGTATEDDLGTETSSDTSSVSGNSDDGSEVASMPTPPDAPSVDGADSASSSDSDTESGSDSQISPPGEAGEADAGDMTVIVDGQPYDIGEPTHDITGDGTPDTVAVEKDGTVEYYVDTDQDGVVDQIVVLDESDGSLINHEVYDAESGTWSNVTEESAQGA